MDPKKFYNERMPQKLGADYEAARWHSNSFQEAQYEMMRGVMRRYVFPFVRGAKKILEVGPGQGTWTKFLLQENSEATYTLVDISAEMLARAQANLPHGASVSFVESDFLAFTSVEPYDVIFSSRAIEYMPDKKAVVSKFASLLRPQGYAIVVTKMPKKFFDTVSGRKPSELHAGQVAPAELIGFFQESGFRIRLVRMATATLPGFKSSSLNRFTFRILSALPLLSPLRVFAESYIVVAQKK